MWLRVAAGCLTLALLAPGVVAARNCGPASLQITVLDESGTAMDGLGADDFRINMRGDSLRAQTMTHGLVPHSSLVLLDRSASMAQNGKFEIARQIALTLAGLTPGVSQFASFAGDVSALSDARSTLVSSALAAGADADHEIYDALAASLKGMKLNSGDAIYVVTDSADSGSRTSSREVQDLVVATGARLFFIVLPGVMVAELDQLASVTGGTVFRPLSGEVNATRAEEAVRNASTWHANIANVYSLEFQEPRPDEKVYPLKITVDKRKLKNGRVLAPAFMAPCPYVPE